MIWRRRLTLWGPVVFIVSMGALLYFGNFPTPVVVAYDLCMGAYIAFTLGALSEKKKRLKDALAHTEELERIREMMLDVIATAYGARVKRERERRAQPAPSN